ncbi:DUF4231 domain-containing protein [Psychroserpens algicola]|uniref:DUF4231 domain-containing protein n=1 Tax=Psychroserpens algicola TaxID=1719034 RepID=A0ABT0H9V3_9FLAO|nr:DUF4231 domain-containing protein [Psychroserpens algicola]MCK8481153.1 DUF4231 domain-containing protein [Psychroserpens algicola]
MEEQINFLENALKQNRAKYSVQRRYMFRLVKLYKYPLVVLSAISTIVLGLQLGENIELIQWQKNIALVITAAITLLTTLMTFWNIEEYWIQNKVIEQQLEILQQKFEYEKSKGFSQDMLKAIFSELQNVIGQHHTYWKNALGERDNDTKTE